MAKIEIDRRYCKSCGLCIGVCPKHLIRWSEEAGETGFFVEQVEEETCSGCRLCGIMCPDAAIRVYR
ncbi:ferredoxin family protein [Cuneatibacter sp. NSJ-177]|uniref:4Fe-4S dicluster domain-containing protein n=1 Tax=Cuneatibacter sp. NSJ-177 TaxID=2931401 RepID=UPI001FD17F44|nr:ferredoxin family protein [Cuneatibacter sp. NSJ-177]MCJ7837516.1 ferredoxin family protein [Cuneatibacter sp. NSJ-177]